MSNLFNEVLTNAKGVEEKLLGPDYDYVNKIKKPDEKSHRVFYFLIRHILVTQLFF